MEGRTGCQYYEKLSQGGARENEVAYLRWADWCDLDRRHELSLGWLDVAVPRQWRTCEAEPVDAHHMWSSRHECSISGNSVPSWGHLSAGGIGWLHCIYQGIHHKCIQRIQLFPCRNHSIGNLFIPRILTSNNQVVHIDCIEIRIFWTYQNYGNAASIRSR